MEPLGSHRMGIILAQRPFTVLGVIRLLQSILAPAKRFKKMRDEPTMDFVVVDVETANADLSSICQVGIASFRGGLLD